MDIAFNSVDGNVYVTNDGMGMVNGTHPNPITVIDGKTNKVIGINPNNGYMYIATGSDNMVSFYRAIISDQPQKLAYSLFHELPDRGLKNGKNSKIWITGINARDADKITRSIF